MLITTSIANGPPVGKTKLLLIAGFTASLLFLVILAAIGLSSMYNNLSRINQSDEVLWFIVFAG